WTAEIADAIVPLRNMRFDNPMFSLTTTYDRDDFTRLLTARFGQSPQTVEDFFRTVRGMNFYDDQRITTGELFERFFPGRADIVRLLMEPIVYANGSTLEDPAITYGIVFANFMAKGVYTFQGGTDRLIEQMRMALVASGVDVRIRTTVDRALVEHGSIRGVSVNGREISADSIVSNANLKATVLDLVGESHFERSFVDALHAVRLNNSSTQVYVGLKAGEEIDESTGDLLFSSTAREFRTELLLSRDITSRTFSFYYPRTRPHAPPRHLIVSSTNAHFADWTGMSDEDYEASKRDLIESTLDALEAYVPRVRERIDHVEAATPRTFQHYTRHWQGSSFGTKFEGLAVSRGLPEQVAGLYHAGSVGIIMSGWLGAMNYGVIVANDVDAYLSRLHHVAPISP
ncbi:MAG TPA: FAD-dependent oxidoreductase, partial [Pirellulaceae bacterium]